MKKICIFTALMLASLAALHAADPTGSDLSPGELEVRQQFQADSVIFTTIRLWPGAAPDEPHKYGDETISTSERNGGSRINVVAQPSVTVIQPKATVLPLPAVLVCPGGGYGSLGVNHGGTDVIRWLNECGIAGVYMKYRVPKRNQGFPMHHQPLQDIQRAMSLIRSRSAELQIDPKRIGVIGFSAGGNLAAMLATHHTKEDRLYSEIDAADQLSCRPDFVMLVAPAYLTKPIISSALDPALLLDKVSRNLTPPVFITSATTDKFSVGASHFALALREKHVSVEVHLYEKGGHAEGVSERTDNQWPLIAADWMRRKGIIEPLPIKP